ncbi:hypothetical protein B1964_07645 [Gordonia sp. i37]|nr:hypothetical protein B1964_07645 [Gordonia sp. i37]
MELYEQTIRVHITPAVGDVRVGELTVGGAERFIESKGETTVAQRCRIILSGMMALAAQHDAIERHPVRDTSTVKRERKKPRALTVDELAIQRRRIGSYAGGNVGHGPPRAITGWSCSSSGWGLVAGSTRRHPRGGLTSTGASPRR